jgi:hypothetical protein
MRWSNSAACWGGSQPAAHRGLVIQVLSAESPLQVLLLPPYDDEVNERYRCHERGQQPQAVGPDRNSELEQGERQIDRISAKR